MPSSGSSAPCPDRSRRQRWKDAAPPLPDLSRSLSPPLVQIPNFFPKDSTPNFLIPSQICRAGYVLVGTALPLLLQIELAGADDHGAAGWCRLTLKCAAMEQIEHMCR